MGETGHHFSHEGRRHALRESFGDLVGRRRDRACTRPHLPHGGHRWSGRAAAWKEPDARSDPGAEGVPGRHRHLTCPGSDRTRRRTSTSARPIELGERIAKILGVKLELLPATWDVIIAGLQANKYDLLLAPLFATEKRKQVVDFVNWTEAGTCYAVLKDNNKVNTLEDLDQPTVSTAVWKGTGTEHAFVAKYKKAKMDSVVMPVTGANRLEDVLSKRVDAATLDSPRAHLVVHQYPQMKIIPGGPDNCIKNPDIPIPIGMAFNYGDAGAQEVPRGGRRRHEGRAAGLAREAQPARVHAAAEVRTPESREATAAFRRRRLTGAFSATRHRPDGDERPSELERAGRHHEPAVSPAPGSG